MITPRLAGRRLCAAVMALVLAALIACSSDDTSSATAANSSTGDMADMAAMDESSADESDHSSDDDHDHDHGDGDHDHGHATAGAATRYDAALADAVQTVVVEVVDGAPVGGVERVEVDLGSVVALMVTSDTAEEVHVHGYDILRAVSDGYPAHFAFKAEIPGVFEVELEGSGLLLTLLEIS